MRKDESKKVMEALGNLGLSLTHVDATNTFSEGTTQLRGQTTCMAISIQYLSH